MYRLHQNHKTQSKIALIIVAAALLTAGMYGLSRLGWVQLNHAVQLVQAKAPPVSRELSTLEQETDSVLPTVEPEVVPPPAAVPVSEQASAVAVAATSCAAQKQAAKNNYESALQAENKKYSSNKSKISDNYSAKGRAFSSDQKRAQKAESDRHSKTVKLLEKNYENEQKKFAC